MRRLPPLGRCHLHLRFSPPTSLFSSFNPCLIFQYVCPRCRFKEKRWDARRMLGSGGMPSSHSATVTALAMAIGLQEGTGGSAFALAVVLSCVVMYDASGVRLHAGRQAELLNQIVCELPLQHPLSNVRPLRDSLGHTPLQPMYFVLLDDEFWAPSLMVSETVILDPQHKPRLLLEPPWDA
ncbi:hypothetical protein HHK36_002131 [Tetracentron sinense]|uniref:Acid phosphatase/vanadium-dependent haloperoxidase-related protein n=1 Tax=Tetracentron sinense TaxID=13715 RepID=A0A834ZXM4_TETSI|nr:hypothetical protein HHK36_002131 [Tetracentron sinense]